MKRTVITVALILAAIAAGCGLWCCQNSQGDYGGKLESIAVGMDNSAVNSLIHVATEQNYFAANGVNLVIKEYASGAAAVEDMLKGQIDLATAAEFVIVVKAFAGARIHTFGSIDKFLHNYVIGRRDRGIENIADLKGKKIAVPLRTAAEFYLGRFLDLHGMNVKEVILVDLPPSKAVDAIADGDVDAVIAWQPNAGLIEDRLGSGIVKWPAQNQQATFCTVISTSAWAAKHPKLIQRFLNSLVKAEIYYVSHPAEARAIVQKRLRYRDTYMAGVSSEHQFSVLLDQSLILAMEDEARWMLSNGLTTEKEVPDFLNYVYADGLKAVRPEAVSIIH